MVETCRYFLKGRCKKGDKCPFKHELPINNDSSSNSTNNSNNNRSNRNNRNRRRRPKNTECFEPSFKPPDMRIISHYVTGDEKVYPRAHSVNDVIALGGLFGDVNDLTICQNLENEINSLESKIKNNKNKDLLKLWHGDTHYIADDKSGWKNQSPTFKMVIDKLTQYFNVDVKATRFNIYKDSSQWKPFHHDAAAVKKDKRDTQNITIAVSFGMEREAAFEHAKSKTTLAMPQPNGTVYVFNKDVNIEWKHGILQKPEPIVKEPRISIIIWGWVDMN